MEAEQVVEERVADDDTEVLLVIRLLSTNKLFVFYY